MMDAWPKDMRKHTGPKANGPAHIVPSDADYYRMRSIRRLPWQT